MAEKRRTRQEKNKMETRRVIFDAAYALLEEKGYEKITMREVAAKAGVGFGTIFQHFKDKTTLLVSIFEYEFKPVVDQAFDTVPKADLKTQLLYLVRIFYLFYAQRPQISKILVKELYIPQFERIRDSFLQEHIPMIEALFDYAQKRGEIDSKVNIKDAVIIWWSYYSFVLFQAIQSPPFDVEEQLAFFERLMDQHFQSIIVGIYPT